MAREIDWKQIRAEWDAGQLSIRSIAKAFGCSEKAIRKKATEEKWPPRPPSIRRRPSPNNRKSAHANSADQAADPGSEDEDPIPETIVVTRSELVHPLDRIIDLVGSQKHRMSRLGSAFSILLQKLDQLLLIVDLEDSSEGEEGSEEAPKPGRSNPLKTMALLTQVLGALVPIARQLNAEERILFGIDDGVPSFLASMTPADAERARKLLRRLAKEMEAGG